MKNIFISPLRIDFAGGWIDVPDFHKEIPGYVVNAAISPHIKKYKNGEVSFNPYKQGGGISSSTGALILKKLSYLVPYSTNHHLYGTPQEIAEMIFHDENIMIKHRIGRQDQYAIALGGINCLRFGHDGFHVHDFDVDIHIDKKTPAIRSLEKRLLLVHSGIKRPAQNIVEIVRDKVNSKKQKYLNALKDIAECGKRAAEAVRRENYEDLAEIMSQNWDAQKRFVPECASPQINETYSAMLNNGAYGGKMCGAGGGGYFVFYCQDAEKVKIEAKRRGLQVIEPKFEMKDILALNGLNPHD